MVVSKPYRYARKKETGLTEMETEALFQNLIGMLGSIVFQLYSTIFF